MLEIQFDRHSCQLHLYAISRIFHTTKPVEENCTLQLSDERLTAQRCGWSHSYLQRAKTLHVLKNLIYLSGTHHNGVLSWLHKIENHLYKQERKRIRCLPQSNKRDILPRMILWVWLVDQVDGMFHTEYIFRIRIF